MKPPSEDGGNVWTLRITLPDGTVARNEATIRRWWKPVAVALECAPLPLPAMKPPSEDGGNQ